MSLLAHFPKMHPCFSISYFENEISMLWSGRMQIGVVIGISTCIMMFKVSWQYFCTELHCVYIPSEHWENQFLNLIRVGQTPLFLYSELKKIFFFLLE